MPSTGLKSFVQAFHHVPATTKAFSTLPAFLVPVTLVPCRSKAQQLRKRSTRNLRRFASFNSPDVSHVDAARYSGRSAQGEPDGVEELLRSRRQREPESWVSLLDRYLPPSLRVQGHTLASGSEEEPLHIAHASLVLYNARRTAKVDLLSYIGVYQERWDAVFWLVKAMLEGSPPTSVLKWHTERFPRVLWDTNGQKLDDITSDHIKVTDYIPSKVPLDDFFGASWVGSGHTGVSQLRRVLGQIWQGLGCMILQVEDRSASNPNREVIMSHILQILAYMHHMNVLPDSIYNYDSAKDRSVMQRPPTLHLLSARILSVLSDVAWKSNWVGEMEMAESHGYKLPPPRIQPQLPWVGGEVWLDLVLWACVEGGWITEAAWLVAEMERRRPNPELRWSVISWDEICAVKKPQLEWTAILKLQIDRSRLNQSTGIGIANSGTSNVEMGMRTISREVILAIMDGLVNTASIDNSLYGNIIGQLQSYLSSCNDLLGQSGMDSVCMNRLILRSIESSALDDTIQPASLQRLLTLMNRAVQPRDLLEDEDSSRCSIHLDFSAALLGLLHRNLDSFARQTNLHGSLLAFKHIQDVIDANRDTYIQEFADDLRERLQRGSDGLGRPEAHERRSSPMLYPEIPPHVVAAFLDLIMETKTFELGKWLLFNDDVDGGVISPNLFSETALQPVLLRFATVTADDDLLMRVLENLEAPLSRSILHALLRCQVALDKWDAVDGILKHFRDTDKMAWTSVDAMYIAAAIQSLEWKDDGIHTGQLLQAKTILQNIVRGVYNSPRNQSRTPDLQEFRKANQLGRIFQSVPGALSTIDLGPQGYLGRASYSTIIPPDAFNILLESVVEHNGVSAGMRLWERWCLDPCIVDPEEQPQVFASEDGSERVVQPTPSMLHSVLRPVIKDLKATTEALSGNSGPRINSRSRKREIHGPAALERADTHLRVSPAVSRESLLTFDWGMGMYKKFGFSDGQLDNEIPRTVRRLIERD